MPSNRRHWEVNRIREIAPTTKPPQYWLSLLAVSVFALGTLAQPAAAAEGSWTDQLWEAVSQGKPALVLRPRIEVAELEQLVEPLENKGFVVTQLTLFDLEGEPPDSWRLHTITPRGKLYLDDRYGADRRWYVGRRLTSS